MTPRRCVLCELQAECLSLEWCPRGQICRECVSELVALWARARRIEIDALKKGPKP